MSFKRLQYLGHSAVLVEGSFGVVAIDPWLEGNPSCPKEFISPKKLDLIALTHGHADHAGDVVRLAKLSGAKIFATYELALLLIEEGISSDQILPVNKGGSLTPLPDLKVVLSHAFHSSSFDSTKRGTRYAGEAGSILLISEGRSIFHGGDTALFSDLALIGSLYKPELALLPIGDRFTMDGYQAAQAAKLLGVKTAIPIHYKTFPLLSQSADTFISACATYNIQSIELAPAGFYELIN
jgi:L-ascorbate metabolism protein UlaG (beta-lactamase superfamily)